MHVNLSVVELLEAGVVDRIVRTLDETRVPPGQLVLEITQTQLLDDAPATAARFQELRAHGIRIALDDFGTASPRSDSWAAYGAAAPAAGSDDSPP